ncbi:MAG: hypothetical protein KAX49_07095 [Halanaerobiales bacterium]|nr:hypothetical protein [Halanaerobiales bacterium]
MSKYVKSDNIDSMVVYNRKKYSKLDQYSELIKRKYDKVKTVTKLKVELDKEGIEIKYSTLSHYIRTRLPKVALENKNNSKKRRCTYINRRAIIN